MRKEYDFSKARKNPNAKRLKKSVTIRLGRACPVDYFRQLAEEAEASVSNSDQSVPARLRRQQSAPICYMERVTKRRRLTNVAADEHSL